MSQGILSFQSNLEKKTSGMEASVVARGGNKLFGIGYHLEHRRKTRRRLDFTV